MHVTLLTLAEDLSFLSSLWYGISPTGKSFNREFLNKRSAWKEATQTAVYILVKLKIATGPSGGETKELK